MSHKRTFGLGFKKLLLGIGISVFLYVLAFSGMNFWLGLKDLDLSFNMLNLGHKADIGTNGELNDLGVIYLRGLNQMKDAVIWLTFNTIFGVWIGYLSKKIHG